MIRSLMVPPLLFILASAPLVHLASAKTQSSDKGGSEVASALTAERSWLAPQSSADALAAKIESEVRKRIANKKNHVKVRMQNGGVVDGRIIEAQDNSFSLTEDKTGRRVEVSYNEVRKVNGRGMSGRMKWGIVAAALAGTAAILTAIALDDLSDWD